MAARGNALGPITGLSDFPHKALGYTHTPFFWGAALEHPQVVPGAPPTGPTVPLTGQTWPRGNY